MVAINDLSEDSKLKISSRPKSKSEFRMNKVKVKLLGNFNS